MRRAESSAPLVATWLLVCGAMVLVMVVLGGVTRLTHSGLSMVEWRPLSVLPPLNEAEWRDFFEKYQLSPEYLKVNAGMTLERFKGIFWLEFIHRLWGRAIGVVVFVPMLALVVARRVDRRLAWQLAGLFVLGALQGLVGWLMVASGLVDQPAVSHYRLAAHLGMAVLIYGAILWVGLGQLWPSPAPAGPAARPLRRGLWGLAALVFVTMMSGALVAGLHAGFFYNTFPDMNGGWWPPEIFEQSPWWHNVFENLATVQFDHRTLAETVVPLALGLWWRSRRLALTPRARLALGGMALTALGQLALGISTLLLIVPVPLAAIHQAGALVVLSFVLWSAHEVRGTGQPQ